MGSHEEPAIDVIDLFGVSRVRAGIIRLARERRTVTAAVLMTELGVARATLDRHIPALVEAGILIRRRSNAHATGRGGRNMLEWQVDLEALHRWTRQLAAELTNPAQPTTER